jgi:hypothetical protein
MTSRCPLRRVGLGVALLVVPGAAFAQALPPPDPAAIWFLEGENSTITTASPSDRYYTNGAAIGRTGPTGELPDFLADFGHFLYGDGRQRLSLDISQDIFTPADTRIKPPDPNDRPYAGYLHADATLIQDTAWTRDMLALQIGITGAPSGAAALQDAVHRAIGQSTDAGWNYQLHTQAAFEILADHVWRIPLATIGDVETDVLPELAAGAGLVRNFALAGGTLRFGHGLDADFGAARLPPGLNGGNAYTPAHDFGWYGFVGVDGQAVASDLFLNGNTFRSSPHVSLVPVVGEIQTGIAFMIDGWRLSYMQVFQTTTFRGQRGGWFEFGSLNIAKRF